MMCTCEWCGDPSCKIERIAVSDLSPAQEETNDAGAQRYLTAKQSKELKRRITEDFYATIKAREDPVAQWEALRKDATGDYKAAEPFSYGAALRASVPEGAPLAIRFNDATVVTSSTGGKKGKKDARLSEIDPWALEQLAKVAGHGSDKYGERLNYRRGYDWSLAYDALQRHAMKAWQGEDLDPDSGLLHFAHVAWHALALLSFFHHQIGTDDRELTDE